MDCSVRPRQEWPCLGKAMSCYGSKPFISVDKLFKLNEPKKKLDEDFKKNADCWEK